MSASHDRQYEGSLNLDLLHGLGEFGIRQSLGLCGDTVLFHVTVNFAEPQIERLFFLETPAEL